MKKAILFLLAFFIIGGGIDTANGQNTYQETISIGVREAKKVFDRAATIRVLMVVEDSRCPEGTTCVQAGNAKVRISVQKGTDASKIVELNTNGENTATVEGFELKLDSLTPSPTSAEPIKQKDYVANLTVKEVGGVARK
jgi:hypothetical protein